MKVGSVNFCAILDRNTQDFIAQARKRNLNTNEMELLFEDVVPGEKVETSKNQDGFLSMGLGKFCGGYSLQTLLKPKFTYNPINNECRFFPYEINQETVDTITNNLKILKRNEELNIYPEDYLIEFKRRYGKTIDI